MTPEEKARIKIDQWFADAGWEVINRDEYEPTSTAVAIREGRLKSNLEADYFLFINGKAVGVLEAKREEQTLFLLKYANRQPYMLEAYLIYIRHIKSHCHLYSHPTERNYTFVISENKTIISNK